MSSSNIVKLLPFASTNLVHILNILYRAIHRETDMNRSMRDSGRPNTKMKMRMTGRRMKMVLRVSHQVLLQPKIVEGEWSWLQGQSDTEFEVSE